MMSLKIATTAPGAGTVGWRNRITSGAQIVECGIDVFGHRCRIFA